MTQISRFSTQDLPLHRRFTAWREELRHRFGRLSATSPANQEFIAWSEKWAEGDTVVCRMRVDPQCIELLPDRDTRKHSAIHAVFPLAGEFHLEQSGHTMVLTPGEWCLYDPSMGFRSSTDHPVEILVLEAPRSVLLAHGIAFDRCSSRRFSSETGSAHVTKSYLATLLEQKAPLHPLTRSELAAVATHLVQLSIMENIDRRSEVNAQELMRARIRAYVSRNLRNPELSIEMIALEHNCSKRYVHKLFSNGETVSHYIRRVRLEHCFVDLSSDELAHLSVTDIAFSWGFQHQGHFSRVFREHFHTSPSRCRPNARAPLDDRGNRVA
jgi:AraC-like DNA-binding protein